MANGFQNFIFGEGTPWTYEQLQQNRKIADQLMGSIGAPRSVGQGLSAIGKALAARSTYKRAGEREGELQTAWDKELANMFGQKDTAIADALTSQNNWNAGVSAPIQQPMMGDVSGVMPADPPSARTYNAGPMSHERFRGATADPVNLGGIASGQNMQDTTSNMPPANDMKPFRDAIGGVESDGSGGYKAVGATDPKLGRALGRYQIMEANLPAWSKAALGREVSVEEFMANAGIQDAIFDHRFGGYVEKYGVENAARAWFGGEGNINNPSGTDVHGRLTIDDYGKQVASAVGGPQGAMPDNAQTNIDPQQILSLMSNPMATPEHKAYLGALLQKQMGVTDETFGVSPIYGTDASGNRMAVQLGNQGGVRTVELPEGFQFDDPNITKVDTGTGTALINSKTGETVAVVEKDVAGAAGAKLEGEALAEAKADFPRVEANAQEMLSVIDGILGSKGLEGGTGYLQGRVGGYNQDVADFIARHEQLEGKTFLQAFQSLKGGGQITEAEGRKATVAIARLQRTQSTPEYRAALMELAEVVQGALDRARAKAGGAATATTTTSENDPLGIR